MSNLDVRTQQAKCEVKVQCNTEMDFPFGSWGEKRGWVSELYTLCKTLIDDGAVTSHGSKKEGRGVRTPLLHALQDTAG